MKSLITLALCFYFSTSFAEDHAVRHHDAHVHGLGQLNIVLENHKLVMEFISPAANIVGFEHEPSNDEQRTLVTRAIQSLKLSDRLFDLSQRARCHVEHVHVESELLENLHAEEHQEHGDSDQEHGDSDHEQQTHTEFHVEYGYECEAPDKLTHI